jgi:hypothetical protein
LAAILGTMASSIPAQTPVVDLPKPDSEGWIKLFRGNNASDFFTYYSDKNKNNAFPDNTFKMSADTVVVSGSPSGHILFKQPFSHYRISYEQMMPDRLGNAGMLLHTQIDDPALWGMFPRSIECQGDPLQGIGQIWCISNVWVKVRATTGSGAPQYNPTAQPIVYGARNDNSRQILGIKKPTLKVGEWVMVEAEVHGSDSLEHLVRGETIIKYSDPHVAPPDNSSKVEKTLTSGLLAWQSEGVPVKYRNIRIKLFPQDPLYKALYPTTSLADYRILPKTAAKPRLDFGQGVIRVMRGDMGIRSVTGRALQLP